MLKINVRVGFGSIDCQFILFHTNVQSVVLELVSNGVRLKKNLVKDFEGTDSF